MTADATVVTPAVLRDWALPRAADKNHRGVVVVLAGSDVNPGAGLLAAEAALRSGAGKVQLVTTTAAAAACAVALPEAAVHGSPTDDQGRLGEGAADLAAELAAGADCLLTGPGLMGPDAAGDLVRRLLDRLRAAQRWPGALVLDALALAAVTDDVEVLHGCGAPVVLSPNREELALCAHVDPDELDQPGDRVAQVAARLAADSSAVVSAGGPASFVAHPDGRLWRDDAGGPGLGVAGSGDVLAGATAGIAARGTSVEQAAVWAGHVHGVAGQRLAGELGPLGYLARDVARRLPRVLAEIES